MQSNISKKNLKRLNELSLSENEEIAKLASIVHEVGRVKPHKRRRLKFLAEKHKELLGQLVATDLIMQKHKLCESQEVLFRDVYSCEA